jgi:cell division protein FtsN
MRIDYSEPKKSCSSPQSSQSRPRKESAGFGLITLFFFGLLCLGLGFGSGWMLSQRAAKKGFKAAMEQQSLENSPQQVKALPAPHQSTLPTPAATQQPPAAGSTPQSGIAGGAQPANDPPLSFYKTLPSGQKSNVLGSGINAKEEKTAKQPLQAAMPANMNKTGSAQTGDDSQKQASQTPPAKPAARQDTASGFTVQVASYSLKSEAETLRGNLTAKGYNVGITESHLGDKGTWYRVRVGKHLDADAAKDLAKKLGKGAIAIPDKE